MDPLLAFVWFAVLPPPRRRGIVRPSRIYFNAERKRLGL